MLVVASFTCHSGPATFGQTLNLVLSIWTAIPFEKMASHRLMQESGKVVPCSQSVIVGSCGGADGGEVETGHALRLS